MKIVVVMTSRGILAVAGFGLGQEKASTQESSTPLIQSGNIRLNNR